jgi:hypothetical protein
MNFRRNSKQSRGKLRRAQNEKLMNNSILLSPSSKQIALEIIGVEARSGSLSCTKILHRRIPFPPFTLDCESLVLPVFSLRV